MKSRLPIFVTFALMIALLIGLNLASFTEVERPLDAETAPNRSTTNAGATGTRALYELLRAKGASVVRWQEPTKKLVAAPSEQAEQSAATRPRTFVIIGDTRAPIEEKDTEEILRWAYDGGRLVIIDRTPNIKLLPQLENFYVTSSQTERPNGATKPSDAEAMTHGVAQLAPVQPTLLTRDVERIAASRFAGSLHVSQSSQSSETDEYEEEDSDESDAPPAPRSDPRRKTSEANGTTSTSVATQRTRSQTVEPPPMIAPSSTSGAQTSEHSVAPVVHFADKRGALLVDYDYGRGRIVVLSDPFIVANTGINRADNVQLALNLFGNLDNNLIAFDEYHQGFRAGGNQLINYFRGTPVLLMLAQFALIVLVILWTRGRRFARALPAAHVDRRSKLEFITSMAELQQRARAYDLAVENIYTRTRRALARLAGKNADASASEIAGALDRRAELSKVELENLMTTCEDTIAGAPTSARESLELARRLRRVEQQLNITRRTREVRQARK